MVKTLQLLLQRVDKYIDRITLEHRLKNTMNANDIDDDDHKSCVRKILDDFRRSLREEFRDPAEAHFHSKNKQSASRSSARKSHQQLPGSSSKPAISVLHDPRIVRQMRSPNDKKSLINDQKQKVTSVDDQSPNNNNKYNMDKLNDQGVNNGHRQKLTLPENQSSTDASEILRNCHIPVVKNTEVNNRTNEMLKSLSPAEAFYIQHNIEMVSPVEKPECLHVSHIDSTDDSTAAPINVQTSRNTASTVTIRDICPQPCERQANSLCANNTDSSTDEDDVSSTPSSFLSYCADAIQRNENESTERSVADIPFTDSNLVDDAQQLDHNHVIIESLTVDSSTISVTEKNGIIVDPPCIGGCKTDAEESPCRESVDVMLTPESADTQFGDLALFEGNIGRLELHCHKCTMSCCIGHLYSENEEGETNNGNEEKLLAQEHDSLEPGRRYAVQGCMKDCRVKSTDSNDQIENFAASVIEYKEQPMPVKDDISLYKHRLNSEHSDQHPGKASDVPTYLKIQHSVTSCMLVSSESTKEDDDSDWLECQCKSGQTQKVSEEHCLKSNDQVTRARSCDNDNTGQNRVSFW